MTMKESITQSCYLVLVTMVLLGQAGLQAETDDAPGGDVSRRIFPGK